jgi:hypothetical protein
LNNRYEIIDLILKLCDFVSSKLKQGLIFRSIDASKLKNQLKWEKWKDTMEEWEVLVCKNFEDGFLKLKDKIKFRLDKLPRTLNNT